MKKIVVSMILVISTYLIAFACLWDNDTIEMENKDFPTIEESIYGKFLRHSNEYYLWKIKDRETKIKESPQKVSLYDDLAVAYSKIGNNKKAIKLMLQKEQIKSGLYTTYANLGTFFIHEGQLRKGIRYIEKAIEINPNAHFGREVYQKYLAQYILKKQKNGKLQFPLSKEESYYSASPVRQIAKDNFYFFLKEKIEETSNKVFDKDELDLAIKGISGMIKFGNHNSPILHEALGDLLYANSSLEAPRHLTALAYLKAAKHAPMGQKIYHKRVSNLFSPQQETDYLKMVFFLHKGEKETKVFLDSIRSDELEWIADEINVDSMFKITYYNKLEDEN